MVEAYTRRSKLYVELSSDHRDQLQHLEKWWLVKKHDTSMRYGWTTKPYHMYRRVDNVARPCWEWVANNTHRELSRCLGLHRILLQPCEIKYVLRQRSRGQGKSINWSSGRILVFCVVQICAPDIGDSEAALSRVR